MSGRAFSILTPVVVGVIGVATGIAIFQPAFKEEAKLKAGQPPSTSSTTAASVTDALTSTSPTSDHSTISNPASTSPPPEQQFRRTEAMVANAGGSTTIPAETPRWGEVQEGQFAVQVEGFEWAGVPLNKYSGAKEARR